MTENKRKHRKLLEIRVNRDKEGRAEKGKLEKGIHSSGREEKWK